MATAKPEFPISNLPVGDGWATGRAIAPDDTASDKLPRLRHQIQREQLDHRLEPAGDRGSCTPPVLAEPHPLKPPPDIPKTALRFVLR